MANHGYRLSMKVPPMSVERDIRNLCRASERQTCVSIWVPPMWISTRFDTCPQPFRQDAKVR